MAGIDDVMERLITDAEFRAALARDPGAALLEYDLAREDIELLASRLDTGDEAERTVEQRTSKSAMLGLLGLLADLPGGETEATAAGSLKTIAAAQTDHNDDAPPGVDDLTHEVEPSQDTHIEITLADAELTGIEVGGGAADAATPTDELVHKIDPGEELVHEIDPGEELVHKIDPEETYNKSSGEIEYSWEIEEGVMSEEDLALTMEDLADDEPEDPAAIELEPARVTSFSFHGTGSDAEPPVDTQEEGFSVPGGDLLEGDPETQEEDLELLPNPEELSQEVAPADALGLGEVAGDAGVDPVPVPAEELADDVFEIGDA